MWFVFIVLISPGIMNTRIFFERVKRPIFDMDLTKFHFSVRDNLSN